MGCNAEHPAFWIVRPIARTLCDALGLGKKSRSCAATLFLVSAGLLLAAWYAARLFDEKIAELVQDYVKNFLTQRLTQAASNYVVQLIISNALFVVLRAIIRAFLYVLYELGRDRSFALLLLVTLLLSSALSVGLFLSGKAPTTFADDQTLLLSLTLASGLVTGWFWKTYILPNASGRRVFDFDVGSALSHLRSR